MGAVYRNQASFVSCNVVNKNTKGIKMGYIVFASIFILIGLIAFGVSFAARNEPGVRKGAYGVVAGMFVLLLVTTAFNSVTSVGARSVGIQTAFGRYQGTLDNGLQIVAPWSEHEDFSTRMQYLDLDGEKWSDGAPVTFSDGGSGVVFATPRWEISENGAGDLWKKYKNFDAVRDQLVKSSAKDSFRAVMTDYSPNEARAKVREVTAKVKDDLQSTLGKYGIKVDSISIRDIGLNKRAQDSLDKVVEAKNKIERAKAEQEQAKIEAETVKIREKSGQLTPEALANRCLDIMDKWSKNNNGTAPAAGFGCGSVGVPFTVTNK
ncbi:band-7-like membrane protein [Streptomyces phage Comrade]|uniref:Band-7-like membrane protein n=3 Tax=Gilsonvirus comrade TaxID=2846395 RepID=A0A345ME44_9CAUD|nr:band-7-like membrane protein [Streptomyces phage Comrade]AXH68825.1 band-7-like membrane protein [Streptomyces phage SparkleGoddess]AXQ63380.1 band-7-like membrane protein [Streptomyces phage Comrade]